MRKFKLMVCYNTLALLLQIDKVVITYRSYYTFS